MKYARKVTISRVIKLYDDILVGKNEKKKLLSEEKSREKLGPPKINKFTNFFFFFSQNREKEGMN